MAIPKRLGRRGSMQDTSAFQEAVASHGVLGCTLFVLAMAHTCFLSEVHADFRHVPLSSHLWLVLQPLWSYLLYLRRCFRRLVAIAQVRSGSVETYPSLCARFR